MPAAAKSTNARQPRSRTGCLVCRLRRVKCDEGQPICGRCTKFNAECKYPDKKSYSDDTIAAGLAERHAYRRKAKREREAAAAAAAEAKVEAAETAGRVLPPLPPNHTVPARDRFASPTGLRSRPRPRISSGHGDTSPSYASPSSSHGGEAYHHRAGDQEWFKFEAPRALFRQTRMGHFYNGPSDPPLFLRVVFPDDVERRCFHHCITYSLSIMVTDEDHNPWVQHVVPLCFAPAGSPRTSTAALQSAFLAFGATHLYSLQLRHPDRVDPVDYRAVANHHRALSATELRQAVKSGGMELDSDTFLAAALALLLNDVFAAGTRWREIWRYVLLAIRRRGGPREILYANGPSASPLRRCLMGLAGFWDFVVSINTMTSPVLMTGDLTWWGELGDAVAHKQHVPPAMPGVSTPASPVSPQLEEDWLERFTAMHPGLFAISAEIVGCAADRAALERLTGPFDMGMMQEFSLLPPPPGTFAPTAAQRELGRRAAVVKNELERWRYELPTSLSCARVQIGSLALWHASRIILLAQVYGYPKLHRDVQSSARAVIELCFEAEDKPEFLQLPVMVACSVLEDPEQRERARAILTTMEYVAVFEVQSLRHVIEDCWRRMAEGVDDQGCRWPDVHVESGRPVLIC